MKKDLPLKKYYGVYHEETSDDAYWSVYDTIDDAVWGEEFNSPIIYSLKPTYLGKFQMKAIKKKMKNDSR